MPNNWFSALILLISAVGGAGGIVGVLTMRRTNQKIHSESELNAATAEQVRANAGVVISQAALDQMNAAIESSKRDAARALEESQKNDELESRLDELEGVVRDYRRAAEEHRRWDVQVAKELRSRGGTVSDPPPLFPTPA